MVRPCASRNTRCGSALAIEQVASSHSTTPQNITRLRQNHSHKNCARLKSALSWSRCSCAVSMCRRINSRSASRARSMSGGSTSRGSRLPPPGNSITLPIARLLVEKLDRKLVWLGQQQLDLRLILGKGHHAASCPKDGPRMNPLGSLARRHEPSVGVAQSHRVIADGAVEHAALGVVLQPFTHCSDSVKRFPRADVNAHCSVSSMVWLCARQNSSACWRVGNVRTLRQNTPLDARVLKLRIRILCFCSTTNTPLRRPPASRMRTIVM